MVSITSTSLENLLIMRPNGVVSKNDIGSRIVRISKLLCKFFAACTQPIPTAKLMAKSAIPTNKEL